MTNTKQTATCPISKLLKVVGAKWTVEIMREVSIQPTRTRQFLAQIPGLSMKCLQERLKELEALDMISRKKFDEKVPRVEHSITPRGERLLNILMQIKQLAEEGSAIPTCSCPIEIYGQQTEEQQLADCPNRPGLEDADAEAV